MPTAQEIITSALRRINVYAPGEALDSADANDALEILNDLLASRSTDEASIYGSVENVLQFTPGQYQYTVGNYVAGTFNGTLVSGSPTISGVTVPSDITVNGDITAGAGVPAGATVLSWDTGLGTITMSANATSTVAVPQTFTYTIPGDFKIDRPLRIGKSFTRINTSGSALDYPIAVVDQQRYNQIGFKAIQAPWPIMLYYNPTMPLGNLFFYQNPSGGGYLHLFTDTILTGYASLTQNVDLPQGYSRFLKWDLARELAPEYAATWTPQMEKQWKEAYDFVRSLNQDPTPTAQYDADLVHRQQTDAGWILTGGFR